MYLIELENKTVSCFQHLQAAKISQGKKGLTVKTQI